MEEASTPVGGGHWNFCIGEAEPSDIELLLPPASNIRWTLGKNVTAEECLEGLEKTYGITADKDELYLHFNE